MIVGLYLRILRRAGGLGQLTDGQTGDADFRLVSPDVNIRGYEWIGWRNASRGSRAPTIVFKFDGVRLVMGARILFTEGTPTEYLNSTVRTAVSSV